MNDNNFTPHSLTDPTLPEPCRAKTAAPCPWLMLCHYSRSAEAHQRRVEVWPKTCFPSHTMQTSSSQSRHTLCPHFGLPT